MSRQRYPTGKEPLVASMVEASSGGDHHHYSVDSPGYRWCTGFNP